jgi:hypothetical protein
MKKIILILCALLILSGCVSYKAVGKFDNNTDIFIGNVNHNLMAGGGKYEFTGVNSNINCSGIASSPDKIPFGLGCTGQEGNANGQCSNGKALTMRWYASSCTTGYGHGNTSDGTRFQFTFGLTKEEAMEALNKMTETTESTAAKSNEFKILRAADNCKKQGFKDKTEEFNKCVLESSR